MRRLMLAPLAHAGQPLAPHDLLTTWPLDPVLVGLLAAGVLVYVRGLRRLWTGDAGRRVLPTWRVWCFAGAAATVTLALLSPLDALSEVLFSAHMAQHLLLTLLAAPLVVLARPLLVASLALPVGARRGWSRARSRLLPTDARSVVWAVAAVVVHGVTMWMWHVPGLYEAALRSEPLHLAEHATLFGGALPIWWLVADARGRHASAAGVLALFVTVLQSGALAGLITFSGEAWFAVPADEVARWGLRPIEDQQLAGGLMWFPGGLAYLIGGAVLFLRWLREDERLLEWQPIRHA